jgi:hypothetical protein
LHDPHRLLLGVGFFLRGILRADRDGGSAKSEDGKGGKQFHAAGSGEFPRAGQARKKDMSATVQNWFWRAISI